METVNWVDCLNEVLNLVFEKEFQERKEKNSLKERPRRKVLQKIFLNAVALSKTG